MAEDRVQRRLSAIMAADVVGYSRLMEADEEGMRARLRSLRAELIDTRIDADGGRIVKTMGDGLLVEYPSAVNAVRSALAIRAAIARRNAEVTEPHRIEYRIGINVGDVIVEEDDIHGDGVNVAARLEGLCLPGEVYVSGTVYDQAGGMPDARFEDLGEQTVRNITRPIRVYRAEAASGTSTPEVKPTDNVPPLPDRPSIAVLPFLNMSGDPDQEYFADGITEDIITDLSRYPDLLIIARNSAFAYKGRAVNAQDVGRELGAHYIVEGSVRKSGSRVRVNVQLIDASTGAHLWAERYDRDLIDVFKIQDELTSAIVATLPGRLWTSEVNRLRRKPPQHMAAFDYVLAGRIHHHRVTREDNAEALRLLDKAIELDSRFAEAYAWKACTLGQAIEFGFTSENPKAVEERAVAAVERALSLDETNVECHRLLCEVHMECQQLDEAVVHNDIALKANPNDPRIVAQKGELLTWLGDAAEGIEWIRKALRLDPFGAAARAHLLGRALFCREDYAEAITAYRQKTSPRYSHLADLAACYAKLGDREAAVERAKAVMRLKPDFSIADYLAKLSFALPADRDRLRDGLREAGLPE